MNSGASSMITCAFVPETPNDETPARRGWPLATQSRRSVSSSTSPVCHSTVDDGASTCRVRGSTP